MHGERTTYMQRFRRAVRSRGGAYNCCGGSVIFATSVLANKHVVCLHRYESSSRIMSDSPTLRMRAAFHGPLGPLGGGRRGYRGEGDVRSSRGACAERTSAGRASGTQVPCSLRRSCCTRICGLAESVVVGINQDVG